MEPHHQHTRKALSLWLTVLFAMMAGAFAGCDKHPSRPKTADLEGRVVDGAGHPVAGARVAVYYHIDVSSLGHVVPGIDTCDAEDPRRGLTVYPNPSPRPRVRAIVRVVNEAQVEMIVVDRSGAAVRTLLRSLVPAGLHAVEWDCRRDDGSPVPSGIYVVRWTSTEGDSVFAACRRILLDVINVEDMGRRAVATTDAGGRFSIPISSLPIFDGGIGTDEVGNLTGNFSILSTVGVCAVADTVPGAAFACIDSVRLGDLSHDVTVTLNLP
jgi:hypothetical protein